MEPKKVPGLKCLVFNVYKIISFAVLIIIFKLLIKQFNLFRKKTDACEKP